LQALLDKYAPGRHYRPLRLNEAQVVTVVEISIETMTGKARPSFSPGDKVRLRPDGEPDERLGTRPFEVEVVDEFLSYVLFYEGLRYLGIKKRRRNFFSDRTRYSTNLAT
jgi:hypothetical protein